jgi:hypothetical protein
MQDHGPVGGNVKDYAADGVLRKDSAAVATPALQNVMKRSEDEH